MGSEEKRRYRAGRTDLDELQYIVPKIAFQCNARARQGLEMFSDYDCRIVFWRML